MKKHSRSIEIWGLYPPPIGGVSIHIKRLIYELNKYQRVILKDFKPKKEYPFNYIIPVNYPIFEIIKLPLVYKRVIHVEQFSYALFFLLLLFGTKHKIGFTVHNQRSILIKTKWKYSLCALFFKRCSFIVMNDGEFKPKFASFFNVSQEKIHVLPAFIAPSEKEKVGLPNRVLQFREAHDFLISANGYKLRLDNGIDVYGLDLLVPLISKIRSKDINVGLLFCLPEIGAVDYYQDIQKQIDSLGIRDHVLIIEGINENGFEYWEVSDLFIRPTSTDMEGLSVKEALYVGTHVVASDVCMRPKECILFRNRDLNDLFEKTLRFYENGEYSSKATFDSYIDVAKETIIIYNSTN